MIPEAARAALGRVFHRRRSAVVAAMAAAAAAAVIAGCGGSVDGGLTMESHAFRIDPQAVAPAPQGTGTFTMEVEGDSKGDRYEAQIYFSAVLADQRTETGGELQPILRSVCVESSCGRIVRFNCSLTVTANPTLPRRIDCTDSLGNRGVQDVPIGDFRVTAYFFPGNAGGFDDDYVDSELPMSVR